MTDLPNGILIVGPAWVGDMIMAQSLFKLLHARWPEREIDVLAPAATVALVSRMPEVSMGILLEQRHGQFGLGYRKRLGTKLRERHYRQAFVLPNSLKSALVPFFADVEIRTGFRGEYRYALLNDMRMLNEKKLPRMVDRFLALGVGVAEPLPEAESPALMVDEANLAALGEKFEVDLKGPVLGICPGAEFGDAKRWPEAHFAALCEYATARGMQILVFGGPNDRVIGERVVSGLSGKAREKTADLTGKTSLLDAIDLLSACSLVVSNDSGLMHVAAAVNAPVAVLYGSTSPAFTPPLSHRAEILTENLPCSPCFKRTCPLRHKNCMNGLLPSRVEAIVDRYVAS